MRSIIRKNILDLEYNKQLQYLNACIVLFFTYIIGVLIAFFSRQISHNKNDLISFFIISFFVLVIILFFLTNIKIKMKNIVNEIEKLNL
ncbi:MAG: hypothetical protein AABX19_00140 [Nanoarchaeota archaeon]